MIQFDSVLVEWYNGVGNWIDITPDILRQQTVRGTRGVMSTGLMDRVGAVGQLSFMLNNSISNSAGLAGYYTPGHANCISVNWGKPYFYPIRIKVVYETRPKFIWYGTFNKPPGGVSVIGGTKGARTVTVNFRDWMGLAQERKLNLLPAGASQRADQAIQLIFDELNANERPQYQRLTEGISTFATVFDDTNSGSTVYSELSKVILSELGYGYARSDRKTGETFVFEHRNLRFNTGGYILTSTSSQDTGGALLLETGDYLLLENGSQLLLDNTFTNVSRVSLSDAECGFLLLENGDYLLLEDGSKLILNETQEATFDESDIMEDRGFSVKYYDNAYQSAKVSLQQKETGGSTVTLWQSATAIFIASGQTITGLRGRYRDPSGGASYVNGTDLQTPASGTDYKMWANQDGTGTDYSANLTITADYGSAEVDYTLYNSGPDAWITNPKLKARGLVVDKYDSLDFVLGDADKTGKNRLDINLHYETDSTVGEQYANDIIRNPDGTITIERLPLWANRDTFNMNAFMDLDIGSLYNISETQTAVENEQPYFINGYEFELFWIMNGNTPTPQIIWYVNGFPYSRVYIPPTA